jgi:hypothetical protein
MTENRFNETAYRELCDKLVPDAGKCETMEGEVLRAASRIAHDYSNNGFGNNWFGALAYLVKYGNAPPMIVSVLRPYAKGRIAATATYDDDDPLYWAVGRLVARAIAQAQRAIADNILTPNPCDMFDLLRR